MTEKQIKSRIVHKHDIEANWKLAVNFTPKQGEIIVYDVDSTHAYERFKIGDGSKNVNDLPFANFSADWSQNNAEKLDFIKNRTHWEENKEIQLDIQWDGTIGDRYHISPADGVAFVKVSDYVPTFEEGKSAFISYVIGGESFDDVSITDTAGIEETEGEDGIGSAWLASIYTESDQSSSAAVVFVVTQAPLNMNGLLCTETGIYFLTDEAGMLTHSSCRVTGLKVTTIQPIVHKLPGKYLPDGVPYEESPDIDIYWDGTTDGKYWTYDMEEQIGYVKISDLLPANEDLVGCTIAFKRGVGTGNEIDIKEKAVIIEESSGNTIIFNSSQDAFVLIVRNPYTPIGQPGTYVMLISETVRVTELHIPGKVHRLGGKYLPEGTPWVENTGEDVILPHTKFDEGIIQLNNLLGLIENEKYRVTYKDISYECVCKPVEATYENLPAFAYFLGNGALLDKFNGISNGLENTGEPFLISDFMNVEISNNIYLVMNQTIIGAMYPNDNDTISITHIKQKYHDVPEKNRTHWAEEVDVPLDIRFDRDKMKYYYCPYSGILHTWVHLSDKVITLDELVDCSLQLEDGSIISLGGVAQEATDYGTTCKITSGDYVEYVIRVVDKPSALALDAKPGVYFKVETNQPEKQVVRMYSTMVTMPGVKYHKLPAEYAPEIPLFDLIEMGMPAVPLDFTDSGNATQLTGVDFTAFEDAVKRGAIRVRYAVDIGGGDPRIMTSMIMPTFDEVTNVWQFAAIGVTYDGSKFTSLRVALMYFVNHATMYGHCALIPHTVITG